MPGPRPILIAGAGPTGLMAALWLNRLGAPFRIVDKHAYASDTSRAAVVQARSLEFYRMLGLSDRALSEGHVAKHLAFFQNQKQVVKRTYGDIGKGKSKFPFVLMFPQDLNEKMMITELTGKGVNIEREIEVTKILQDPKKDFVDVKLKRKDGVEETFEASYVLGCDGGHSTVKETSNITSTGGTYSQRFFVADVEGEVQVGLDNVNICFNAADFCLLFGMPNGRIRLAGWAPNEAVGEEFTFKDVEESVKINTGTKVKKVHWFSTYKVRHGVADSFRDGRIFLCGDAAHVHSPVGGQGMNTGLGDAVNISWKLAAVLAGKISPAALDTYEPERRPFAMTLVSTTDRAFGFATARSWLGRTYRTIMLGYVTPLAFNLGLLDNRIFETISQIRIGYRGQGMSDKKIVSTLHPGDRLPWVEFEDGTDNFEPLNAMNWQIHVYGTTDAALKSWAGEKQIAVHEFPFNGDVQAKLIPQNAAILIRPDGHIGCLAAGSSEKDVAELQAYLDKWGIVSL
ncbi:hypothetical protein ABW19_dt0210498 [Dactylella cylindrospora]|nr:hypothetical protein ABW19_dt0210498 [Dactylella cylindrospora]